MTIFMVTHDLKESFYLGTRLLVFDKVRVDSQAQNRYGATITYNIPLKGHRCIQALGAACVTDKLTDEQNILRYPLPLGR
jgi:NitT/TauT family transport system ATP-binding protein